MKKTLCLILAVLTAICCMTPALADETPGVQSVTVNFVQPSAEFTGAYGFVVSEDGNYCYSPDVNGEYVYYDGDGQFYEYANLVLDEDRALFENTHKTASYIDRTFYMYSTTAGSYVRLPDNPLTPADKIFVATYTAKNKVEYQAYFCKKTDADAKDLENFRKFGDPNDDGDATNDNQLQYYNITPADFKHTAVGKKSGDYVRLPNNHVTSSAVSVSSWYVTTEGVRNMADFCLKEDVVQADLDTLTANDDVREDGTHYTYRLLTAVENENGLYVRLPENPVTDLDDCISAVYHTENGRLYTAWFCLAHYAALDDLKRFITEGDPNDDGNSDNDHQLMYYDLTTNSNAQDADENDVGNEQYYIGGRRYSPQYIGDIKASENSKGDYILLSEEDAAANGVKSSVEAYELNAGNLKEYKNYYPVAFLTLDNIKKYINADTVYYSLECLNTITVTEPTTVSFRVITSKQYDVTTATVFYQYYLKSGYTLKKDKQTPNTYGEYTMYIDPAAFTDVVNATLNVCVAEKDEYGNNALLPSRFTVTLTKGDGYSVKPLSGENNRDVYYGESYTFRVKITKGYSAAGMTVKVMAGNNDLSSLLGGDIESIMMLLQKDDATRNENRLVATGVDGDGYCTFRIDNVTADCKIMVSGVEKTADDGTTSSVLSMLKRILRAILHIFGIDTSFLEDYGVNILTDYKVLFDETSFDTYGATYTVITSADSDPLAKKTIDEATGYKVINMLGGESITLQVKCDSPDAVDVVWNTKPDEYKVTWIAKQNRLTGDIQYVATYYISNISQDLTISCVPG